MSQSQLACKQCAVAVASADNSAAGERYINYNLAPTFASPTLLVLVIVTC